MKKKEIETRSCTRFSSHLVQVKDDHLRYGSLFYESFILYIT